MPITPNMDLILPDVSETPGPEWATELNTALTAIDSHDHTSGSGLQVPTAGININEALSMNTYDLTRIRSTRYENQAAALGDAGDVGCIYVAGGNMFFNDSSGVQIQLTAGGALNAASIGGIGGDYSTSSASVYYQSIDETFYFTSDTNTPATINMGSAIIREPSVTSPNAITIKSPTSLSASYDLTLPTALPASTRVLSMSAAGAVQPGVASAIVAADLGTSSVTTDKIAALAVTAAKIGAYVNPVRVPFTSSGTLTVPTGITSGWLRGWGAGGGGGNSVLGTISGSGGDGAPEGYIFVSGLTPGATHAVTIGTSSAATEGSSTTVASLATFRGGGPGGSDGADKARAPGSGASGGEAGQYGGNSALGLGGNPGSGGGGPWGGGGGAGPGGSGPQGGGSNAPGVAGDANSGAGGSGAGYGGTQPGGAGGSGYVEFIYNAIV